MSELTLCNYCSLQRIRAKAKQEGKRVVIKSSPWAEAIGIGSIGGYEIYCVPKDQQLDRKKHHVGWMMEIPDKCCC